MDVQGLDSTTAMHLLQLLRQLSQGGRAIVTTIHQPSSRLYQQLDKLLLLSQVSHRSAPVLPKVAQFTTTGAELSGSTASLTGLSRGTVGEHWQMCINVTH